MLTQEKADIITKYLDENEDKRKELFELEPAEAAKELNKVGIDCTAQELEEYGKALQISLAKDELSPEQLESVAGGVVTVSIGVAVAWGIAGAVVGYAVNSKWKW
ncbi:MAG: class IIb bacteriocin, lactobin A/cerein 7B family [Clostridia bacterium]|nr:class IIb bacteriocin, lactobin A/cerein 7B family [Clostridia bacterium]